MEHVMSRFMKKILIAILLFMWVFVGTASFSMAKAETNWDGNGNGTKESPYQIGTAAQLMEFRDIVNGTNGKTKNAAACAELTANITLSCNENDQWMPIGWEEKSDYLRETDLGVGYVGVFDGKGHTVSGLYFDNTETEWDNSSNDAIGLFGVIGRTDDSNFGVVKNVTVAGTLKADLYVGGIAGCSYGTIENCVNNVLIDSNQCVGGIVGKAFAGTIVRRCTNNAALSARYTLGGIVGYAIAFFDNSTKESSPIIIINCINNGALSATSYTSIGGVCGLIASYTRVVYCANNGAITIDGTTYSYEGSVGGVVGEVRGVESGWPYDVEQALVGNCYNAGDITVNAEARIGGIVGLAGYEALITKCLNYGTITGSSQTYGGVSGSQYGTSATYKFLYYKEGTASKPGNATALTDEQLKDKETFKNSDTYTSYESPYNLDFDRTWEIVTNYPILKNLDSTEIAYVIETIKNIGNGMYHFPDSGPAVYAAKTAYLFLSENQLNNLPETYGNKIVEAVTVYAVLEKIYSIGKIYYSEKVKEALDFAALELGKLTDEQLQLISEYDRESIVFYQQQYANAVALYNDLGQVGDGSDENPFLIGTKEELLRVSEVISASYKLTNDIDLECDKNNQWVPIGFYPSDDSNARTTELGNGVTREYIGTFYGDGHTIKNVYIDVYDGQVNESVEYYNETVGFFTTIGSQGRVENLTIEGTIKGDYNVGGIAAMNNGIIDGCVNKADITCLSNAGGITSRNYGKIINSKNEGTVTGSLESLGEYVTTGCIGGIAGTSTNYIKNCANSGNITGRERVGGIAGVNNYSIIWGCSNSGNVNGYQRTGGIAGHAIIPTEWDENFSIEQSCNTGNVTGTSDYTGGIVGYVEHPYDSSTKLRNCYNTGTITGTDYVGGLVGILDYSCEIRTSHNVGTVNGTGTNVSQLVGLNQGTIYRSYYRSDNGGDNTLTTEQFKDLNNFKNSYNDTAWNTEVWMNGGEYPIFISAERIHANNVAIIIGNIGSVSYTANSKAAIDAALEEYNKLTEEEKALVPQDKIDALQKAINDYEAVDATVELIDAIGEVTFPTSIDAIDAAKDAVADLTNDQLAMLGDHLNDLKEAEADYAEGAIDAIGEVTFPNSKDAIDAAKDALAGLDNNQLAMVENLDDLKDAETEYAEGAIDAIGNVTYPNSKDAIDAAKDVVAGLDAGQLASLENLDDLLDAEKLYDAMGKINDIGEVNYPNSKDALDAAKGAVAALDEDLLPLLGDYLDDLKDAETEYAEGAIDAIGDVTYPNSKSALDAAKDAIADLSEEQLADLDNLDDLLDKEKLYDAMGKINDIGNVSYPGSKAAIDAAKDAVAALDEDLLPLLGDYLEDLKDAEAKYVEKAIDGIGEITYPNSKDAIEAVEELLAELDEEQLAKINNLDGLKEALVEYTEKAIEAIGEVTYPNSKAAIEAVKGLLEVLDEEQLALIDNLDDFKDAEVKYVDKAIEAIGEVTYPNSKDAIEAAKELLADLDEEQLAKVNNLDDLKDAEVDYVKAAIEAIGEVVYPNSEDAILAARDAYNDVDDELKQYVSNYDKLVAAEEKFVETVEALIAAIGDVEYSYECEEKIEAANAIYDALDEHFKSLVDNADKLEQDNDDYDSVHEAVLAINRIGTVSYVDEIKNSLDDARKLVYDLSDYQKSILPDESLKILVDDEKAYEAMDKINNIGTIANTEDCKKIQDAKEYYDSLTADQKKLVSDEFVEKIAYFVEANAVIEHINNIGKPQYTTESKSLIDLARVEYDKLTEEQKALVINYNTLTKDEADYEAVDKVVKEINNIGNITYGDESNKKITDARTSYDGLTEDQAGFIPEATEAELVNYEKTYAALNAFYSIGDVTYSQESEELINEARKAYDELTPEQKALINDDDLNVLITAEENYKTQNTTGTVWLVILWILTVASLCGGLFFIYLLLFKNRKQKQTKAMSVTPIGLIVLASHLADPGYVALYVFAGLAVAVWIAVLVIYILKKKGIITMGNKPEEKADTTTVEMPTTEEATLVTETDNQDEEETVIETDNEGNTFKIQYVKSFKARLIQSDDELKRQYIELKKEILAYNGTKSKFTWHFETVSVGKNAILRFAIRGKVLCLYFALDFSEYVNTKFKLENVTTKKQSSTPCLYRIRSEKRFNYAKELIKKLAKENNLEKGAYPEEDFYLPYEERDVLVEQGLIKKNAVKVNLTEALEIGVKPMETEEPHPTKVVKEEPVAEEAPKDEEKVEETKPLEETSAEEPKVEEPKPEEKAPVEEPKEEKTQPEEEAPVQPEPEKEEEAEEEVEVETATDSEGHVVKIQYVKSFKAKLIQSNDELKKQYIELKKEILSYRGTKSKITWHFETISLGKNVLLRFALRGKTLCVYYALNYDEYADSKYKVENITTKKHSSAPTLYRIKNDRRFGYAKELIQELANKNNLEKGEEPNDDFYLAYEERDALIEQGLIKKNEVKIK